MTSPPSPSRERLKRKRLTFDLYGSQEDEKEKGEESRECSESPLKFHPLDFRSNPPSPTTAVDEYEIKNDENEQTIFESEPIFSHISESQVVEDDSEKSVILFETPPRRWNESPILTTPHRNFTPLPIIVEQNTEFIAEFLTPKKGEKIEVVDESIISQKLNQSLKSQEASQEPEINLSASTVDSSDSPPLKTSNGLVAQMKSFLATHKSSIRMFPIDVKKGKLNFEDSLLIKICQIYQLVDGFLLTNCLKINEETNGNIWVLFKPDTILEIGASLTLFSPWLKIYVDILGKEVIYSTDFFKLEKSDDMKDPRLEIPFITENLGMLKETEADTIFYTIIPYWIRNEKTAKKQARGEKEEVDLDVVVCQLIEGEGMFEVLVKDSDNFCSLIQILDVPEDPTSSNLNQIRRAQFSPGKRFSFHNLGFSGKVTLKMWLPIFAVFSAYGCQQRFHYNLMFLEGISSYENAPDEARIPFVSSDGSKQSCIVDISNALKIQSSVDTRVWLNGRMQKMDSNKLYVKDETGEILQIVYSAFFPIDNYKGFIKSKEIVKISMLRLFRGTASVDKYSWITSTLPGSSESKAEQNCKRLF